MSGAFENLNGILISPVARKTFAAFESRYNHLRGQEGRNFTAEELKALPVTASVHRFHREWEMRRNTTEKFLKYLGEKKGSHHILDVGCGIGFFSNLMARQGHKVSAVDVSLYELEQAARAFGTRNPVWYYADVQHDKIPGEAYDLITIQASLQYFEKPAELFTHLLKLLKPGGEIHVLESPLYNDEMGAEAARKRSFLHFQSMGAADMTPFYHFHTWDIFKPFTHQVKEKGSGRLFRLLKKNASPFPWIIIKKT